MRVQITLKSGAQIEFDAETLDNHKNKFTQEIVELKWTTPDNASRKLSSVNLDSIDAIVVGGDNG